MMKMMILGTITIMAWMLTISKMIIRLDRVLDSNEILYSIKETFFERWQLTVNYLYGDVYVFVI